MTQTSWILVGASGFVGSAISQQLDNLAQPYRPLSAPRLTSQAQDARQIIQEARQQQDLIDQLAQQVNGAQVLINAAGLASPDQSQLAPLLGANALLPALLALAAAQARVPRLIHLSSAAVQGPVPVLDASPRTQPFSPYSRSKALGEEALLLLADQLPELNISILRATSVQGVQRQTTRSLVKVASSPLASVAGDGQQKTPVSSAQALADFTHCLAAYPGQLPAIVLQPWEGATCASVLEDAGGRKPWKIPSPLARVLIRLGYGASRLWAGAAGPVRRLEVMWFGQDIDDSWARQEKLVPVYRVGQVLQEARASRS